MHSKVCGLSSTCQHCKLAQLVAFSFGARSVELGYDTLEHSSTTASMHTAVFACVRWQENKSNFCTYVQYPQTTLQLLLSFSLSRYACIQKLLLFMFVCLPVPASNAPYRSMSCYDLFIKSLLRIMSCIVCAGL